MKKINKFYAVARGRNPGIYTRWFGEAGAESQVNGFPGARFKGFPSLEEARRWLDSHNGEPAPLSTTPKNKQADIPFKKNRGALTEEPDFPAEIKRPAEVVIYTDGACTGNPGAGGYGTVIIDKDKRIELSGGYRLTTNNRMELTAIIRGLASLKKPSRVTLYSDSKYVVDAVTKGWAKKWRARGWFKSDGAPAKNPDLWSILLDLLDYHDVNFVWVKGHAGNRENEHCDQLAVTAAQLPDLPPDSGYEQSRD